jgi:hypothetical protein
VFVESVVTGATHDYQVAVEFFTDVCIRAMVNVEGTSVAVTELAPVFRRF